MEGALYGGAPLGEGVPEEPGAPAPQLKFGGVDVKGLAEQLRPVVPEPMTAPVTPTGAPKLSLPPPTVDDDLEPWHVFTKDKLAEKLKKRRNTEWYFGEDHAHKSTDTMRQEESAAREDADFMELLNRYMSGSQLMIELDDSAMTKSQAEVDELMKQRPERPHLRPLQQPSREGLAIASLLAIAMPDSAFDTLSQPWRYGLFKQERDRQEDLADWQDATTFWQLKLGVAREKAEQVSAAYAAQVKSVNEANSKHLERMFDAAKVDWNSAREMEKFTADWAMKFQMAEREQQYTLAKTFAAGMLNGNSPQLRGVFTQIWNAIGIGPTVSPEALMEMTPDEVVKSLQGAKLEYEIKTQPVKDAMQLDLDAAKLQEQRIQNEYLPKLLMGKLDETYSAINARELGTRLDYAKFDYAKQGGSTKTKAVRDEMSAATKALEKAVSDQDKAARDLGLKMAARESAARARLEKAGQWSKAEGKFAGVFGGKSQERADAENEAKIQQELSRDPEYQELKAQKAAVDGQLADARGSLASLKALDPGSVRGDVVARVGGTLGRLKTWDAVADELIGELDGGTILPSEAVAAARMVRVGSAEQRQGFELDVWTKAATAAGLSASNAREYAEMLTYGGGAGGAGFQQGELGEKYVGKYEYDMRRGKGQLDCSSFTQCVYKDKGIAIPGTAQSQYEASVAVNDPQPGDLVFFKDTKPSSGRKGLRVHHVGIVASVDGGKVTMRHMSSAKDDVQTIGLEEYLKGTGGRMQYLGVRRPKAVNG